MNRDSLRWEIYIIVAIHHCLSCRTWGVQATPKLYEDKPSEGFDEFQRRSSHRGSGYLYTQYKHARSESHPDLARQ